VSWSHLTAVSAELFAKAAAELRITVCRRVWLPIA
jgi:hypothetical protein